MLFNVQCPGLTGIYAHCNRDMSPSWGVSFSFESNESKEEAWSKIRNLVMAGHALARAGIKNERTLDLLVVHTPVPGQKFSFGVCAKSSKDFENFPEMIQRTLNAMQSGGVDSQQINAKLLVGNVVYAQEGKE